MTPPRQRDLLPAILVGLTVTTGLVDAVSVLGLGGVFTANMTGNVVFLGFASVGTPGFSVARSIVALVSFLVGAIVGGRLGLAMAGATRRRWLLTVAGIETSLFAIAALVATGYDHPALAPTDRLYELIVLMGFAMGIRNATVRRLAVPDLTTTVMTLALAGLAADSWLAGGGDPRRGRRVAGVVSIFLGAALGAALVNTGGLVRPLLISGGLVMVLTVAYALHPSSTVEAHDAR
jgi:uncharacterized membrane protein YoaK (UPF0700 family)